MLFDVFARVAKRRNQRYEDHRTAIQKQLCGFCDPADILIAVGIRKTQVGT